MSQAPKDSGRYEWSLSDPDLLRTQAYINGEWVDPVEPRTLDVEIEIPEQGYQRTTLLDRDSLEELLEFEEPGESGDERR